MTFLEYSALASIGGLLAWLTYAMYDVVIDPHSEIREAALQDFTHPAISRYDANSKRIAEWRRWARGKRAWANNIPDRKWRRANLGWCSYFERMIDEAEAEWEHDCRVDALAARMRPRAGSRSNG
jgi:hypothetical protein